MVKESEIGNSVVGSETSHRCGRSCLGPLTFHPLAVGDKVSLSQGGRLAERTGATFKNGLVFSSRPAKIQERIRLRVEKDSLNWQGALRVGFTNVPPLDRSLPLPIMAIPNLTDVQGHWAAPVPESHCQTGSELEFWLSNGGSLYVTSGNIKQHKLLTGVDLSQPHWAMIDIYGQTCAISLLGSEKRELLYTRRSCPAPEHLTSPDADSHNSLIPVSSLLGNSDECISCLDMTAPAGKGSVMGCVVCMEKEARITLPCGHQCLCKQCAAKVLQEFGTCPLCRHRISTPSVDRL
ncbi:E3 ubiquitin-protein ligase NEURL3-like [Anoplopoma fimbria]|uniref:E3 ubiquitin-protein ligase NEURL3-like n=1 Tax=Anoplopoma fimbria TaxID=229290 RepID=UPI0023EC234E|nr:E3 ubiquitin-protein ligase NEURL3-like [Anoplopoma fimbria]XP_054483399.1 E3 ubiquitin-protein ligase NEURL3-like [Anoplopoma fimbria]